MSGVWDTEKETERRRWGGLSFQSNACQALTKVLVLRGGEGVRDMDWGDGRARRDTDLQQGLFQGSLHSPRLHFDWYQTDSTSLSLPETRQLALQPCCSFTFWCSASTYEGEITQRGGAEQHPPRLRLRSNLISQVNPTRKHTYNSQ